MTSPLARRLLAALMLGVTLFGLFLTPVFFVTLRSGGRHRAEAVAERRKNAALDAADL